MQCEGGPGGLSYFFFYGHPPYTPSTRMEIRTWRSAIADLRTENTTAGSALGCARERQPRLGLAVRCGDLAP